jgi:hypothetical protein
MDYEPSKQMVTNSIASIRDELNCIGELFHSTVTHWNGQKLTWNHKCFLKKYPSSSMNYGPSKQVVKSF